MNAVSVVADLADRSTAMPIIGPPGVPPLNERDLVTAVLDTTAALIVVMDRRGAIVRFNRACERLTGYTAAEVEGKLVWDLFLSPEEMASVRVVFEDLLAENLPSEHENYWLTKTGERRLISWANTALVGDEGEVKYVVATGVDITDHRKAESALRTSEAELRALFTAMTDVILVFDVEGRCLHVAPTNPELLYKPAAEIIGKTLHEVFPKPQADALLSTIRRALATRAAVNTEYSLTISDREVWFFATVSPMLDNSVVVVARDVTESKHAVETLQRAAAQYEQLYQTADYRQREFQALHEIEQAINALDVERCLQSVATYAQSLVQADMGRVFLVEPGGLRLQAASGLHADQAGTLVLPSGQGLCSWVAKCRQMAYAPNAQNDPRYHNTIPTTRSEISIPLVYQREVIGVLDIQSSRLDAFSATDVDVLGRLAAQAAIAIGNARLFEAEQHSRQVSQALLKVATAFKAGRDTDELLKAVIEAARDAVPYTRATLMLRDPATGRFAIRAQRGMPDAHRFKTAAIDINDYSNLRQIVTSRQPVIGTDPQMDPAWVPVEGTEGIRSWLGAPLLANREVIGLLTFSTDQPDQYNADHLRLVEAFAHQIGLVLENAQLFGEIRRQAGHERVINEITNKVRRSMDLDEIIRTTVDELGCLLGASRCLIRLGADMNFMPIAREFHQAGLEPLPDESATLPAGIIRQLSNRASLVLNDTRGRWPALEQLGICAYLATPIVVHDELLGALIFHECETTRNWADDEIDLVESIAAQVGIAIENAHLYGETRRQLGELAILHTAAIATASSSTLHEALQRVAQSIYDAFDLTSAAVLLINPETGELTSRARVGTGSADDNPTFQLSQGITGWVAQTGQPALLPDVAADPHYLAVDPAVRSELCIPLRRGDKIIGVLNVESHKRDAFTERDMQLLTTLGHNLSAIIENIHLLEEVRAANLRLQELDRLKSQFVANMSHELRTPLNSIIGFSEVLGDGLVGDLSNEQRDYIRRINSSGKHLLALINDVLDLSKIQAGRMTLDLQPCDLTSVIAEVRSIIAPITERKHQQLIVEAPTNLPTLQADTLRIKQVLLNLLSNACKFTPDAGTIKLGAAQIEEDTLLVTVSDNGRGIPPAEQAAIFEEFNQGKAAKATSEKGTGLGLAITRHLVERHGGKIWVESAGQPGLGATFYFTLPVETEPPASAALDEPVQPAAEETEPPTPRRLAVVIEGDRAFNNELARYLRQDDYRVEQWLSGVNVLPALHELKPDLITLDLLLPDKDGWALLSEIKRDPLLRDASVLVISTLEPAQTGLKHSAVDYLSKPLTRNDLLKTLKRLNIQRIDRPGRILIVDDDPMLIELVQAMLPAPNYHVAGLTRASKVLEQLHTAAELPDLIILDLPMPDMNGFELLRALRSDSYTRELPVLILTAKTLTPAEQAELTASAQGMIVKDTLQRELLLEEVHRLEKVRAAAQALAA